MSFESRPGNPDQRFQFGPYSFDPVTGLLDGDEGEVVLQPKVAAVLHHLVRSPGRVISKQELLDAVWEDTCVADSALADAVSVLRQALGDDPREPTYVQTLHRRGYRFVAEVDASLSAPGPPAVAAPAASRPAARIAVLLAAAVLIAVSAWTLGSRFRGPGGEDLPVTRLTLDLLDTEGGEIALVKGEWFGLGISPTRPELVYAGIASDNELRLFRRGLGRFESVPLPATGGGRGPFFSPDGEWVGFFVGYREPVLKMASLADGHVTSLGVLPVSGVFNGSWSDDGTIFIAAPDGVWRLASEGGEPELVVEPDEDHALRTVETLPGSKAILFTDVARGGRSKELFAYDLVRERRIALGIAGSSPTYTASGHLLFARDRGQRGAASRVAGTLYAVPFDIGRLEPTGAPREVVDGVAVWTVGEAAYFTSDSGWLVYQQGQALPRERSLLWAEPSAACPGARPCVLEAEVTAHRKRFRTPRLAPNGKELTLRLQETNGEHLWTLDLERDTLVPVTSQEANFNPQWTPDGRAVVFQTAREGQIGIYRKRLGSDDAPEIVAPFGNSYDVTPDGAHLVHNYQTDLWETPLDGEGDGRLLIATPGVDRDPEISPDGRWIVYVSNQTGQNEVHLRAYEGVGDGIVLSSRGGVEPAWSPEGDRIYYRERDKLMVVDLDPATFEPTPARPYLAYDYLVGGGGRHWEPASGGRILVVRPLGADEPVSQQYRVVLNWFDELESLVPAR